MHWETLPHLARTLKSACLLAASLAAWCGICPASICFVFVELELMAYPNSNDIILYGHISCKSVFSNVLPASQMPELWLAKCESRHMHYKSMLLAWHTSKGCWMLLNFHQCLKSCPDFLAKGPAALLVSVGLAHCYLRLRKNQAPPKTNLELWRVATFEMQLAHELLGMPYFTLLDLTCR